MKNSTKSKIPTAADAPPNIYRIYKMLDKQFKQKNSSTEKVLCSIFGLKTWKNSTKKWVYIENLVNAAAFLDVLQDAFINCEHCGYAQPLDTGEGSVVCDNCKKIIIE